MEILSNGDATSDIDAFSTRFLYLICILLGKIEMESATRREAPKLILQ